MKTKFQPDISDEYLKFGIYFKSENDITAQYLIELCEGKFEGNAIVKIYTTGILDNYFKTEELVNGSIIGVPDFETDWIADLDLYGKYFYPKFKNDLQLYYDDKKYYTGSYNSNSISSLMECINYAIEYGLNKSGIKPY